jgi:iron complex transport system substrate-binding protein
MKAAKDRVVAPRDVAARDPEVVIGSWCGKRVSKKAIREREGWEAVSAVRAGHLYEVASAVILQSGPAALTEGVRQIHALLARVVGSEVDPRLAPSWPLDRDRGAK